MNLYKKVMLWFWLELCWIYKSTVENQHLNHTGFSNWTWHINSFIQIFISNVLYIKSPLLHICISIALCTSSFIYHYNFFNSIFYMQLHNAFYNLELYAMTLLIDWLILVVLFIALDDHITYSFTLFFS